MVRDTMKNIEEKIESSSSMCEEDRRELLKLIATLEKEIVAFEKTHPEQAQSIRHFAHSSLHEATRDRKDEQLLGISLAGLRSSISGFEGTHDRLVSTVNSIALVLSNMGL